MLSQDVCIKVQTILSDASNKQQLLSKYKLLLLQLIISVSNLTNLFIKKLYLIFNLEIEVRF